MVQTILVTGATGYLGSHIVVQLLDEGYDVKGVARSSKIEALKKAYADYGPRFQAVAIQDIIYDQFPDAFKGVDALIHTASPLPTRQSPEKVLEGAVEGTLNIIRQAQKAGIKKFVVTSSIAAVYNPRNSFTDKDWNPITKDQALSGTPMQTYAASKTFAEQELWAFNDAHPDLDITTFNPPFLYGPLAPTFIETLPKGDFAALSTALQIYQFLTPTGVYPQSAGQADVRDVARVHVLALSAPATSEVGRKRIIFGSPHGFDFIKIRELIKEKRPELKDRLINEDTEVPKLPRDRIPVDFGRVKEVLGVEQEELRTIEETMLDTVDSLLELEKKWRGEGVEIVIPQ